MMKTMCVQTESIRKAGILCTFLIQCRLNGRNVQQKEGLLLFVTALFSLRETLSLGDRRILLSTLLTLLGMIDSEV